MRKIRILIVQYRINYLKVDTNLSKFERILKKYVFFKPDLVIFPEYALSGPLYGHYNLAFEDDDEIFEKLKALAIKFKINLIPGSFVRVLAGKRLNSSCFLDKHGKIISFYDKQKLWSSEKRFLKPGNGNQVIETSLGKFCIQICADLNSPKISQDYKKQKPEIIINLAMWSQEDIKAAKKKVPVEIELTQTETLVKARALENRAYFVFCNYAGGIEIKAKRGRSYKETSIGNSMVADPYGKIIASTSTNQEEVLMVELNLAKCHWADY